LWLIKVWFSASTFVVKIATFAKPKTVMPKLKKTNDSEKKTNNINNNFDRFFLL
jgi:hypothetical protein